jgi:alanyl-tRNA synthetase
VTELETRTHTALHLVKGAIVKVLGDEAAWTTSAYVKDGHGRIHVEFDRKPSDEEIELIEKMANQIVEKDEEIEMLKLDREEAERRWGDRIYDKFPIPKEIRTLDLFHLAGWNINACNKQHNDSTGEVGKITITKTRFRNSRNELEVSYDIED